MTERLFDDDAPPAAPVLQLGVADAVNRRFVVAGLRREIEQDVAFGVPRLLHFFEPRRELRVCIGIVQIAGEVEQVLAEVGPQALVERRVFEELLKRFPHLFAERFVGHPGSRVADDGEARRQIGDRKPAGKEPESACAW